MDAIDRLHRASSTLGLNDWDRDPRQIQLAILEELTLMRKAWEQVAAGKERLLEAVKSE